MSHNIRIVLVETSHPGNIGAAARAMKTMCLSELVLVNPGEFPHADASARASGAVDLLEQARVVTTTEEVSGTFPHCRDVERRRDMPDQHSVENRG